MVTSRAADPATSENSYIKSPHQSWFLDLDESFSNPTRLFMAPRLERFFRSFRANALFVAGTQGSVKPPPWEPVGFEGASPLRREAQKRFEPGLLGPGNLNKSE